MRAWQRGRSRGLEGLKGGSKQRLGGYGGVLGETWNVLKGVGGCPS